MSEQTEELQQSHQRERERATMPGHPAYANVGTRVAAILEAAEAAAEQIRVDALNEAADIRRQAEAETALRRNDLVDEAERLRAEADAYASDTRRAVESYATQQRRDAEQHAAELLESAREEAQAMRRAAVEAAKEIENASRHRQHELREEVRSLEARMQGALEGLHDIAAQLEELVAAGRDAGKSDSLADALNVQRRGSRAAAR